MPTAIVTGASRGLGLALSQALAERGWRLVIDAREAGPLEAAAAELPDVVSLPGDVSDPSHRRALVEAAGERIDLLVNNASLLGPSPQPALADYPLDVLEAVYRVNVIAPLALIQLALPRLSERRPHRQRHLRRRGRALRGLGRLRLLQGRARAADRDPRRRAPGAPRLRRRPRRHEHAHAPGGLPGRGHLRPRGARGARARAAGADRGRAAQRPLRRRGADGVARVSAALAFTLTPAHEAGAPPEARGLERDEVRLLVARRDRPALVHDTLPRPARAPARRRPARGQHLRDDPRRAARHARRRHRRRPPPLDAGAGRRRSVAREDRRRAGRRRGRLAGRRAAALVAALGRRAAPRRRALPLGRRRRAARAARRAARRSWWPPTSRPGGCGSPRSTSRCRSTATWPSTAARSPTAISPARGRCATSRPCSPTSRAARRCRAPAARSRSACSTTCSPAASRSRRSCCTPASPRSSAASARTRSATASPPTTAIRVNAHRAAGGRVIAVGTTVVRALETVASPDGRVEAGAGWTGLMITPERGVRAIDGLITGWHEPDASHLLMLEAVGGRDLIERSYDAALTAGYRWHEFGDSHLILR